jgi:Tfp pilus assembly protein PilN
MLTTNLSTRPFYNERAVRTILGLVLLLVIALSIFSLVKASALRSKWLALSAQAREALDQADVLRAQTRAMTAQIDPKELAAVSAAAAEANSVISQREFSWTMLLQQIEGALPDDVRVTSVQPVVEKGMTTIRLDVEAMSPEHLAAFMDALEKTGSFERVLNRENNHGEDDLISATLQATYRRSSTPGAPTAASPAAGRGGRGE